ncbi:DsbA family protein [Candidatus Peregrinibacteria bacterium]|nr:MAG: DsbA family protein [Candidatus Peregrinibacteria bacterium]
MNRLFVFAIAFATLPSFFISSAYASETVGFVQALNNTVTLESYDSTVRLNVTGKADGMRFQLRINTDSTSSQYAPFLYDQSSNLRAQLDVELTDPQTKQTDLVHFLAHAELIAKNNHDLYVRINNLSVDGHEDFLASVGSVRDAVEPYLNQWFRLPVTQSVNGVALGEDGDVVLHSYESLLSDPAALQVRMGTVGISGVLSELLTEALTDGIAVVAPDIDAAAVESLVAELQGLTYFNQSAIEVGPKKGYVRFTLNKGVIRDVMEAVSRFSDQAGFADEDRFTLEDIEEASAQLAPFLRSTLLHGMYHIDPTFQVVDRFQAQFSLKEAGDLESLVVEYSASVLNMNAPRTVLAPANATDLEPMLNSLSSFESADDDFLDDSALENGSVLPDVTRTFSEREMQALFKDNPAMGNPAAPIKVVEFTDFQCPFCGSFAEETFPMIRQMFIQTGKVYWVVRDMPLEFHEHAFEAAVAAECVQETAGDEGYFVFHDYLFAHQDALGPDLYQSWADERGLGDEFYSCVSEQRQVADVEQDMRDALALEISGTPSFLINGTVVTGAQPYEVFKALFEELLK